MSFIVGVRRRRNTPGLFGLVAALGLVSPSVSASEPESPVIPPAPPEAFPAALDLTWDAPEGCSSAAAIEARIEAMLSGAPRGVGVARVEAVVTRVPGGVTMDLRTTYDGRADVRTVNARTCRALEDSTAVLLAIALEPTLAAEPPEPRPEPIAADPSVLPQQPRKRPAEPRPRPSSNSTTHRVPSGPAPSSTPAVTPTGSVALGGERGMFGQTPPAGRVDIGIAARRWRIEAQGRYFAPRRRTGDDAAVLVQAGTGGLRGCWTPHVGSWVLAACGGAEAGGLWAASRNLDPAERGVGPIVGMNAAFEVGRRLGPIELWGGLEAFGRIWGTRIRLRNAPLLEPSPVSVRFGLGVRFGPK